MGGREDENATQHALPQTVQTFTPPCQRHVPCAHSMVLFRAISTRCSSSQRFMTQYLPSCSR